MAGAGADLSDEDRDALLDALGNPPAPNVALKQAAQRYDSEVESSPDMPPAPFARKMTGIVDMTDQDERDLLDTNDRE